MKLYNNTRSYIMCCSYQSTISSIQFFYVLTWHLRKMQEELLNIGALNKINNFKTSSTSCLLLTVFANSIKIKFRLQIGTLFCINMLTHK